VVLWLQQMNGPTKTKPKPALSSEALNLVAQRFKLLGDPTRLRILQELFEGELSVQDIGERVGTSQANISKHLSSLLDQGILGRRKEGLYVYYFIADASIFALCELVCTSLADRFERARTQFEPK
jgi:DNA-binding transcriptional ArsR family regulator